MGIAVKSENSDVEYRFGLLFSIRDILKYVNFFRTILLLSACVDMVKSKIFYCEC